MNVRDAAAAILDDLSARCAELHCIGPANLLSAEATRIRMTNCQISEPLTRRAEEKVRQQAIPEDENP